MGSSQETSGCCRYGIDGRMGVEAECDGFFGCVLDRPACSGVLLCVDGVELD